MLSMLPMLPMPEYPATEELDTIHIDGHEEGQHVPVLDRKRKRSSFMKEMTVFSSMTQAVKEVAIAIRVHPQVYGAVMHQVGFSPEALRVALSHLLDNKSQGVGFVAMGEAHRVLSLRTRLDKHYY
ncbi:Histone-lysine N-methyltransferase SUVR5 [Hordeum vulgare]|nr:Histone-lysine N-methyltransferase SUVR5 [Hordeum vulgare]